MSPPLYRLQEKKASSPSSLCLPGAHHCSEDKTSKAILFLPFPSFTLPSLPPPVRVTAGGGKEGERENRYSIHFLSTAHLGSRSFPSETSQKRQQV